MDDFDDAASFKAALRNTQQSTQLSPPFVHLFSRWAVFCKKLDKYFARSWTSYSINLRFYHPKITN